MRKIWTLIIISISVIPCAAQTMRPIEDLINTKDPGWPLVQDWITKATNAVEILPPDSARAKEAVQLGASKAVNMAFYRLAKDEYLHRLARGLYYIPKTYPGAGLIRPALEEIAQAVAEKNRIRIRPTGAYALNKLGLSTQVPTRVVFLTNGQHRILTDNTGY